jgi:hypothetical protein
MMSNQNDEAKAVAIKAILDGRKAAAAALLPSVSWFLERMLPAE